MDESPSRRSYSLSGRSAGTEDRPMMTLKILIVTAAALAVTALLDAAHIIPV